ncbi:neurogenic locus notch homolog protein 1-like [Ptychodera flava]|uniref:neurogenic locus notch homolog protein 1-like n=1 Tax=Ptychodera flava TaxID=63121 RepID=UPI00396A5C3B
MRKVKRLASFLLLLCWTFCPVECDILLTITHVSPTVILTKWRISGVITGDDILVFLDPPHGGEFPLHVDKTQTEHSFTGLIPATQYGISVSAFINGRNETAVVTRSTTKNPCDNNPCQNGGVCQLVIGLYTAYSCYCSQCYSGEHCEYGPAACESNPCQNGGVCSLKEGSCTEYQCQCPDCYTGYSCEIDNNACRSNPCPIKEGFNTSCVPLGELCNDYECRCNNPVDGCFIGKDCEKVYNPCQPNPCVHGVCLPNENSCDYRCDCPGCYTGETCESLLDPCEPNPCQHGECVRDDRSCYQYSCVCDECYTGKLCDQYFEDPCSFYSPCRNNASCVSVPDSCMEYNCQCIDCYEGKVCQKYHNPCESGPCLNGGTCDPLEGTCILYNCTCPTCFTGEQCQTSIDACQSSPCKHGGTCTPSDDCLQYTCQCNTWWIGPNCSWSLVSILIAGQVVFIAFLIAINITVVCVRRSKKRKKREKQRQRKNRRMTMKSHINNGYSVDISSNGNIPSAITSDGSQDQAMSIAVDDLSTLSSDDDESVKKSDLSKDLSEVAHDFCDNTTWHGLPNIGRSRSGASRLLWALVVVGACIGFIVQASVMMIRFYDRKTNIDMEETGATTLKFPAVTICNTNKVRASAYWTATTSLR